MTPWTVAHQASPSMGLSRQEYWSGLPFPCSGDLPDPGIKPRSPALQADALTSEPPGKHHWKALENSMNALQPIMNLKHEIFPKFQSCQGIWYLLTSFKILYLKPPVLSSHPSFVTTPHGKWQIISLMSCPWPLGMLFSFLHNLFIYFFGHIMQHVGP